MDTSVYLTHEQLVRMASLSLDALIGIQFDTDARDNSSVTGCYVSIDSPDRIVFFEITSDGTLVSHSS